MSKSRKLKSEKSKKLSKRKNSPNFDAIEVGQNFLTFNTKIAFNYLRLTFIKVLIIHSFDLKYQIWDKSNILNYAIDKVLS